MNKINKINVCCQKVLPLVYDESLSYYEVLCKVIQKLNELIKINNNIRDEIHREYVEILENAKQVTEAVATATQARDEVLSLKQATEQYAHDVTTVYNQTVEARDTAIAKANIAEQSATTATEKANIAQASATTATEKANIASQSATTATQKADSAQQSATVATEKAEIAVTNADKVITAMSLVAGTVNYYEAPQTWTKSILKYNNIQVEQTVFPFIRNNVLYVTVELTQTFTGQHVFKLPNTTTVNLSMTDTFNWLRGKLSNLDTANFNHVSYCGSLQQTEGTIGDCVTMASGNSKDAITDVPLYPVDLQIFSNTATELVVDTNKTAVFKYKFTIEQPLKFLNEVTPAPTDYITKLNEETQAREQADTQLQNNINTEKTAREQADTALQQNIDNLSNDVVTATTQTLGKVLEALYAQQRTGKIYGVKIPAYANSTTSSCVKTDDNTDIAIPTPATDTVEGIDEYLNIPLFQWMNCNYIREDDGTPIVTALEGSSNYMTEGAVDVGVIGMTYYEDWKVLDDGTIYYRRSDKKNVPAGIVTPCKQAVRQDGSVMPYFIFPKYYSGIASDGFLRSNYGLKPARNQSYNNMMTEYPKKGTGYHGGSVMRQTFGILNMALKYATKNSQKYFAGVTGYSFQYALAEKSAEERTYVVVTEQQANDILVGGGVSVGYDGTTSSDKDRGNPTMHAYADDVRVLSKEAQGDGNYRIYLDCNPFVTTLPSGADESKVNVYITSMPAHAGWTDAVKGAYDGSPVSNRDGKHPFRLFGLEYSVGGYEAVSDAVMNINSGYITDVYRCERWATRKTTLSDIQDNYTKVGTIPVDGAYNSDFWIGDYGITDGCWYPSSIGSSDSFGVCDMVYRGGTNTGLREFLMGGGLWDGSAAGLCCLGCGGGLGLAGWLFLSAD